jgi:hypothetical protein
VTDNERKLNTAHRAVAVASGTLSVMISRRKLNKGTLNTIATNMRKVADLLESME